MRIVNPFNKYWVIGLLLSPPFLSAETLPEWQIVPAESNLTFTATQNGAPVSGEFKKFTGDILVDPANYQASKIHIIVDINSLYASYAELVSTLASSDWFDAKLFPKADFVATDFKKTGDKTYQANGKLTIRDKTAPITLSFTAEETAKNKALVVGSTTFKRTTFGVGQGEWSSTEEVKDDVKVEFKLVALKKQ